MTRAALVLSAIAAAAVLPVAAANAGVTSGSTYVVRGVVVQYIPPAGSVVGSLSIRVQSTNAQGRRLLGELVTVPVARALRANQLVPQQSRCAVTLDAPSPGSVLKGAAVVKAIVPSTPASAHGAGGTDRTAPKVDPETTSPASDGGGTAQPNDHGDGETGDRASGHAAANGGSGAANAAAGQAHAAAAGSNAHKVTP